MRLPLKIGTIALACTAGAAPLHASSDLRDIRSAVYCLTQGPIRMLARVPADRYAVIYSRDDVTDPSEENLLIFAKLKGDRYDAFVIKVSGQTFDIQNNATMRAGRRGVTYLSDPLGGIWTHDYIAAQFVRALKRRPMTIASDRLPPPRPVCRQFGKRVETR